MHREQHEKPRSQCSLSTKVWFSIFAEPWAHYHFPTNPLVFASTLTEEEKGRGGGERKKEKAEEEKRKREERERKKEVRNGGKEERGKGRRMKERGGGKGRVKEEERNSK